MNIYQKCLKSIRTLLRRPDQVTVTARNSWFLPAHRPGKSAKTYSAMTIINYCPELSGDTVRTFLTARSEYPGEYIVELFEMPAELLRVILESEGNRKVDGQHYQVADSSGMPTYFMVNGDYLDINKYLTLPSNARQESVEASVSLKDLHKVWRKITQMNPEAGTLDVMSIEEFANGKI